MCTTAEVIKACAADKLKLNRATDDLQLVEIKSNGERTVFKDHDVSVPTALCLNGRIFVAPKEHLDALVSSQLRQAMKRTQSNFGAISDWVDTSE